MWDLFLKALSHPIAYSGFRKKHTLTLERKVDDGNTCFSFFFTSPEKISWHPGEHGVFYFGNFHLFKKNWRAFSIASSPHENTILLSTMIPETPSDFKKKLANLQIGETITMRGPFGEFKTGTAPRKIVGIAGGVGVTPFRSILSAISAGLLPNIQIELIFAGKNNYFLYDNECHHFAEHPNVTISYVNNVDEVNAAIDDAVNRNKNTASYFISGSPGMIGAVRKRLRSAGIKKIVNDPFKGY